MAKGRSLKLSENRRLVLDVCALSRDVPLFPAERTMTLAPVAAARSSAASRVSWTALMAKALGIAAVEHPHMRQAYMPWPWPRLYEHSFSTASIAVHRDVDGEDRLCWAKVSRVEEQPLTEIQHQLDLFKNESVETAFSKQVRLSRLPRPLRRLAWRFALHFSGRERAKSIGTFTLSSMAGLGVYNRMHPTVLTSSLSYGPVEDDGTCLVTLICDHRVIDGYRAALILHQLEAALNGEILEELKTLRKPEVCESRAA